MTSVSPIGPTGLVAQNGDATATQCVNGATLDSNHQVLRTTVDALIAALGITIRADNLLVDSAVRLRSLDPEVTALLGSGSAGVVWQPKVQVSLASTANLTLSGEQTIDGILTSASRILVKDQTVQSQNGIYVTGAGAWTRATDANTAALIGYAMCYVVAGTANATTVWINTISASLITLGTTALPFARLSANAGANISSAMIPVVSAATVAVARAALGSTATGDALYTAGTPLVARQTIGIVAAMDAVVAALTTAAARAAMGPWSDALVTVTGGTTARDLQTRFAEILNPMDFGAAGNGTTDDRAALAAALALIGSSTAAIRITKAHKIASNITIPSNVTLVFMAGGSLVLPTGVIATCNGPIMAGAYQIFSGVAGQSQVRGTPKVDAILPEWFGAVADGATDCTNAIQSAVWCCDETQCNLRFGVGTYLTTKEVAIKRNNGVVANGSSAGRDYAITGAGPASSYLKLNNPSSGVFTARGFFVVSNDAGNLSFRDLSITVDAASWNPRAAICFDYASGVVMSNCFTGGANYGVETRGLIDSTFTGCFFENSRNTGVKLDDNTGLIASDIGTPVRASQQCRFIGCSIVTNGGATDNLDTYNYNGIFIYNASRCHFIGCDVYGSTDCNVNVRGGTENTFTSCTFQAPVGSTTNPFNVLINSTTSAEVQFVNCTIEGAASTKVGLHLGFGGTNGIARCVNTRFVGTFVTTKVQDANNNGLKTWIGDACPIIGASYAIADNGNWLFANNDGHLYYKNGRPSSTTDGEKYGKIVSGTGTINPGTITNGSTFAQTGLTLTGAVFGQPISAAAPYDLQGCTVSAYVTAANTFTLRITNNTGAGVTLASGTWNFVAVNP